jgi:hypothetical protein
MQIGFLPAAIIVFSHVEVNQKESASLKPTKMLIGYGAGAMIL